MKEDATTRQLKHCHITILRDRIVGCGHLKQSRSDFLKFVVLCLDMIVPNRRQGALMLLIQGLHRMRSTIAQKMSVRTENGTGRRWGQQTASYKAPVGGNTGHDAKASYRRNEKSGKHVWQGTPVQWGVGAEEGRESRRDSLIPSLRLECLEIFQKIRRVVSFHLVISPSLKYCSSSCVDRFSVVLSGGLVPRANPSCKCLAVTSSLPGLPWMS